MPKITPLRLIDRAILPVIIVFGAKLGSILVFSSVFNYTWSLDYNFSANHLFFLTFENKNDIYVLSNISNFVVVLLTACYFTWVLFKAEYLGQNHIHPNLMTKLYESGREFFISKEEIVYHEATVWFTISWFVLFTIALDVSAGNSSFMILGFAFAVVTMLSVVLWNHLAKN